MGKKTDAQLKTLKEKGEACAHTATSLINVMKAWPALDNEWSKWEPEMRKLSDYEDHPYMKKRGAVWQMGRNLSDKLKDEIHALNMAVVAFRGFVAKKEKSKNPFKSKNSLPSSKETIKMYDKAMKGLTDLAMSGGSTFR